MNIVLTGSEGFIGSVLRKRLEKLNHNVICWDLKINKDIKDFKLSSITDFVIHLAAIGNVRESIINPKPYYLTNVEYSKNIFNQCKEKNIPCLYASSSCAYFPEKSPYGHSKKLMEESAYDNQVGLRFTTVYGKVPRTGMLFDKIINKTVTHKTNHIRDFIYVDDVVNAILLFIKTGLKDKNKVYNVCTGTGVKVKEIIEYMGFDVPLKNGEDCEAENNTNDNFELRKLGWKPNMKIFKFLKDLKTDINI
jgi:nucleoside-diphosphate-sugar epimerase